MTSAKDVPHADDKKDQTVQTEKSKPSVKKKRRKVRADYTQSNLSELDLSVRTRRWHNLESQEFKADALLVFETYSERWSTWCEFFWSASTSTVGLGNIWRFPAVAAKNGGGAFLVPYIILTVVLGYPMVNLEFALGQFVSHGPLRFWEISPIFRGVGVMVIFVNFLTASYYIVLIGWCLNYFVYSCYSTFPWDAHKANQSLDVAANEFFLYGHLGLPKINKSMRQFSLGTGLDGPPQWNLVVGIVGAWILIWLSLVGGVRVAGKCAYVLGIFPIVYLVFLAGACIGLEGSFEGIVFFFEPKWMKLFDLHTWFEAAVQCFFSLNIGFGEMIILASYKDFSQGINTDTFLVIFVDVLVSVLAGVSLFALMGNLAYLTNSTTERVMNDALKDESFGIAFIMFPQVTRSFGEYPGPQFFAATFFLMLLIVSVGSGSGFVTVIVGGLCDFFPKLNKAMMTTVMCVLLCLSGIIYCCPSGLDLFDMVGEFGSTYMAFVIVLLQTVAVTWVYGLKNFANDLEFMSNKRVSRIKLFCWVLLCPAVMLGLFVAHFYHYEMPPHRPWIAQIAGFCLFGVSVAFVPLMAIIVICTRKSRKCWKKIKASIRPTAVWGPKDPVIYKAWRKFKRQRPNEFRCTTRICFALCLRKDVNSHHVESHYTTAAPSSVKVSDSSETIDDMTVVLPPPNHNQNLRTRQSNESRILRNDSTTSANV